MIILFQPLGGGSGIIVNHFTNPGSVTLAVERNRIASSSAAISYSASSASSTLEPSDILHILDNTLYSENDPFSGSGDTNTVEIGTDLSADLCLRYLNNLTTPQTTILFQNFNGPTAKFNLEPIGTGNSGIIREVGVITDVPANTCE